MSGLRKHCKLPVTLRQRTHMALRIGPSDHYDLMLAVHHTLSRKFHDPQVRQPKVIRCTGRLTFVPPSRGPQLDECKVVDVERSVYHSVSSHIEHTKAMVMLLRPLTSLARRESGSDSTILGWSGAGRF